MVVSENHDKDINEEIEKELLEYLENKDEIEASKPKKKKYMSMVFLCSLIIALLYISRIVMNIF